MHGTLVDCQPWAVVGLNKGCNKFFDLFVHWKYAPSFAPCSHLKVRIFSILHEAWMRDACVVNVASSNALETLACRSHIGSTRASCESHFMMAKLLSLRCAVHIFIAS